MRKRADAVSTLSLARVLLVTAVLLPAAAAMGLAGEAPAGEPSPRIEFTEAAFDFGTMYQNEEVTHLFTFRNVGKALLKIGKVKSSCGCTAAMPEKRELGPGEKTNLKVTFRSGAMRDRVVKHVYIDSNDPVEPRVTLTIEGEVRVEVNADLEVVSEVRIDVIEQVEHVGLAQENDLHINGDRLRLE